MEHKSITNQHNFIGHLPVSELTGTNHKPQLLSRIGKKSFLVHKHDKYTLVPTETIAFFYVKNETTIIVSFDKNEYLVGYSLEQIQQLVSDQQFYRLNQQYLINCRAIKEIERYFARKLLVNLVISFTEKLLVSKENAKAFLAWLESR
jgi:two-component system, LytTR family, response regulator LytT